MYNLPVIQHSYEELRKLSSLSFLNNFYAMGISSAIESKVDEILSHSDDIFASFLKKTAMLT
jgi:hypothetical protein